MSSEPEVRYSSIFPRIEVALALAALRSVSEASGRFRHHETGGILLGQYEGDGARAAVLEATSMPRDSRFGRSWFRRGSDGLSRLLREKWQEGLHYVGEWHSHPGSTPEPSMADITAMASIADDPRYQCSAPILLVIGGGPPGRFSISLSVMVGREPVRLRYGAAPFAFPKK